MLKENPWKSTAHCTKNIHQLLIMHTNYMLDRLLNQWYVCNNLWWNIYGKIWDNAKNIYCDLKKNDNKYDWPWTTDKGCSIVIVVYSCYLNYKMSFEKKKKIPMHFISVDSSRLICQINEIHSSRIGIPMVAIKPSLDNFISTDANVNP